MDISFKELTKFTYFMPVSAIDTTFTDEAGIIVRMCSTNERSRYYVTLSLIGRVHAQNDPCDAMRCPQWVQSKATLKPWLTFKQLGFFFKYIYIYGYCCLSLQYSCMKPIQYKKYLVSIVDVNSLVR